MKYKVDVNAPVLSKLPLISMLILLGFKNMIHEQSQTIFFGSFIIISSVLLILLIQTNKKYRFLEFGECEFIFQGTRIHSKMIKKIKANSFPRNMVIYFNERRLSMSVTCRKEDKQQFFQDLKQWAFNNNVAYSYEERKSNW